MKYRKKTEIVDVIQYTGGNRNEILAFGDGCVVERGERLYLGGTPISPEAWLVKDAGDMFYLWTSGFLAYYEPVLTEDPVCDKIEGS